MSAEAWDPKQEAMRLWGTDPCGGAVGAFAEGTPEFFAAVDRDRYGVYAPWLREAAGFADTAGQRVLEIGCGMGTDLASFARAGATAVAVDLTPRHLGIARQRLTVEGHPVRLARADGEVLPFRSGTFDIAYSFGVLHHTPGTEQAVDEIWRVLKPGGRAIVALYHRDSVFYWFFTLFFRGLIQRRLFTEGYRKLLGDIERHEHSDAVPLVKVYSRGGMRTLFRRFASVRTEVHHLQVSHFAHLAPIVRRLPPGWMDRASHRWGWYIFANATK